MTDEERYRIIGYAVSNHIEAKKILAGLLTKADATTAMLRGVVLKIHAAPTSGQRVVLELPTTIAWPTVSDMQALLDQISAMKKEIAEIDQELVGLGITP